MFRQLWSYWWKHKRQETSEEELKNLIDPSRLPRHIAIIMDGNGRWARRRGLPRVHGHRAGMLALKETVKACLELGIKVLTVYAFSTENWKRPSEEVQALMDLLVEYVDRELDELVKEGVRVRQIGLRSGLPGSALAAIQRAEEKTAGNERLVFNIALNYGGRSEIVVAARALAEKVKAGSMQPEQIDEESFAAHLFTAGLPDPDLLIRPAGDLRISNFLLWQLAYTEFWLTSIFWPDFRRYHLLQAIVDYQQRERRFGGLPGKGEQPLC